MTLDDWQVLDARIAREVMGYSHSYAHGADCWSYSLGPRSGAVILQSQWQPHKDVSQALMAVHQIIEQGWWFRLDAGCRFYAGVRARFAWAASYKAYYVGYDKLEAKAICLALEAWLDA